jgi:hypothetical protein
MATEADHIAARCAAILATQAGLPEGITVEAYDDAVRRPGTMIRFAFGGRTAVVDVVAFTPPAAPMTVIAGALRRCGVLEAMAEAQAG